MATVRVTPGANFDPNNFETPSGSLINNPDSHSYSIDIANSPAGLTYLLRDNTTRQSQNLFMPGRAYGPNDGLFADFSDNTGGVNLTGGNRGDVLRGGSANDTLNGGDGNDVLEGGRGTNTINGGDGIDTVSYEHYQTGDGSLLGVIVNMQLDGASSYDLSSSPNPIQDTLVGIENVRGSALADAILGGTGRNVMEGGGGADTIRAGTGDGGNDASDVASYLHSAAGVTVNLAGGANTGGDAEGDILDGIQNVYGSTHADSLTGNDNANLLYGQGGSDALDGAGGDDKLFVRRNPNSVAGGEGVDQLQLYGGGTFTFTDANFTGVESVAVYGGQTADFSSVSANGLLISSRSLANDAAATITGGSGADRIKAGAAGDTITGGGGNDVLAAGAGDDTFVYGASGFGRDVLYGVDTETDHIDLRGLADSLGDLMLRESGSGASLATTVTIAGAQPGDAIALRGVSIADIQGSADFFQFT